MELYVSSRGTAIYSLRYECMDLLLHSPTSFYYELIN